MSGARIYSMTCGDCGFIEEHRVRSGTEPRFNMVEPRRIRDATGATVTVATCPLCGGHVIGEVRGG